MPRVRCQTILLIALRTRACEGFSFTPLKPTMESINLLNKILLSGKRVIVRGDIDVPIENGKVTDAARLESIRETLDYLTLRDAKVILIGHLGRPEGKVVESLRSNPVSDYFSSAGYKISKIDAILSNEVSGLVSNAPNGSIILLENLRFDPREEANDQNFAAGLASLGDLYVNECFSTSLRPHASFIGIPKFLKHFAGLRLVREVETIKRVIENADKPLVSIIGGVKLETKLPVISKLLSISDYMLLGGKLGLSYEGDNNYKVLVPVDYTGENKEDIGLKTINMFVNTIKMAKTVIWNGPMGKFEQDEFITGTKDVAEAIIDSKAFSLVGGGDTIACLDKLGLRDKMSFVSMGGGALLEFISGKRLPGLEALGYYV